MPVAGVNPGMDRSDARLLAALDELGRLAAARTDLREIAREAAAVVKEALSLAYVSLVGVDHDTLEAIRLAVATDFDLPATRDGRFPLGAGVVARAAREGRAIYVPDVAADPGYLAVIPGVVSELAAPVKVAGRVVAVLNCESREARGLEGRQSLLELVAARLGIALENAELLRREEADREGLARKAAQLELLNEVARIATLDLELQPMLQRVTDALAKRFNWEFVALMSIDEVRRRFRCEALTSSVPTEVFVGYGRELGSGVVGEVAATGRPILIDDVAGWPNYVETLPGARSELCVPVRHGDRIVAIVNLESVRPAAFHDQLGLLETVAEQVAGAIASAQLYAEARKRAGQLGMLSEISREAMESADLQALLDRVVAYVQQRFTLEIVGLLLYHPASDELEFSAFAGKMEVAFRRGARWPPGRGILGRCVRSREPQLLLDVAADPDYVSINPLVKAEYALPILSQGELLGVLDLESPSPEAFSPANIPVLRTIVDQIAGAIARARLLEDSRRRAAELDLLSQVSRTALETEDLSALLGRIARFIQSRLGLSITAILLYDEAAGMCELAAHEGEIVVAVKIGERWPAGRGIIGRAVRSGEPQLVPDVRADPDYVAASPDVRAEYAVPIRFQGRVLGAMNFEHTDPEFFTPAAQILLRTFVDQVAGAIHLAAVNRRLGEANRTLTDLFSRYVAPELVQTLLEKPEALGSRGEKREVSVLFADIRGFTRLSQRLDSEQTLALLNEYFAAMGEEVFARRGSINRYLGDGLMAVFGVPVALPGHAGAAVRAALGMQAAVEKLQPRWRALTGEPLEVVIGINAGPVTVGTLGDPRHLEFTVIGDTVNVAARLESEAKARGAKILVTESVRKRVTAAVDDDALGEIDIRGREGRVKVYRLQ